MTLKVAWTLAKSGPNIHYDAKWYNACFYDDDVDGYTEIRL